MKEKAALKIKKEFSALTGIVPASQANYLEDKKMRRNFTFDKLADRVFDYPRLLKVLSKEMEKWLHLDRSEFVCSLAGYIYYLKGDFKSAEKYFLEALKFDPRNLDSWFDLAFSLYHQSPDKHKLAKQILFNFDSCVRHFEEETVSLTNIRKFLRSI